MQAPDPFARRRRRWPWVLAAALVVVVTGLVLGVRALGGEGSAPVAAKPSPTPSSPASDTNAANGCLGGTHITGPSVVAAKDATALTDIGAAEFAAMFYRFMVSDAVTADDIRLVGDQVLTQTANSDLVAGFNDAATAIENGTWRVDGDVYSTEGGAYFIESSSPTQTVVSVAVSYTSADAVAQTRAWTFTLTPSDSGWQVSDVTTQRSAADVDRLGSRYVGGCV